MPCCPYETKKSVTINLSSRYGSAYLLAKISGHAVYIGQRPDEREIPALRCLSCKYIWTDSGFCCQQWLKPAHNWVNKSLIMSGLLHVTTY